MFSSTTMKLSTSMPTAKAIPARLRTLSERPIRYRQRNMPTVLTAMARKMTAAERVLRRKINNTIKVSAAPSTMFSRTKSIAE
jgi:hypothetical protein